MVRLRVCHLLVAINTRIVQRLLSDTEVGCWNDSLVVYMIPTGRAVSIPGDWIASHGSRYRRAPIPY